MLWAIPSTVPGSVVLGHLTGLRKSENKSQQEITHPWLPIAELLLHPKCQQQTAGAVTFWFVCASSVCRARAACPACAWRGSQCGTGLESIREGWAPLPDVLLSLAGHATGFRSSSEVPRSGISTLAGRRLPKNACGRCHRSHRSTSHNPAWTPLPLWQLHILFVPRVLKGSLEMRPKVSILVLSLLLFAFSCLSLLRDQGSGLKP